MPLIEELTLEKIEKIRKEKKIVEMMEMGHPSGEGEMKTGEKIAENTATDLRNPLKDKELVEKIKKQEAEEFIKEAEKLLDKSFPTPR